MKSKDNATRLVTHKKESVLLSTEKVNEIKEFRDKRTNACDAILMSKDQKHNMYC